MPGLRTISLNYYTARDKGHEHKVHCICNNGATVKKIANNTNQILFSPRRHTLWFMKPDELEYLQNFVIEPRPN